MMQKKLSVKWMLLFFIFTMIIKNMIIPGVSLIISSNTAKDALANALIQFFVLIIMSLLFFILNQRLSVNISTSDEDTEDLLDTIGIQKITWKQSVLCFFVAILTYITLRQFSEAYTLMRLSIDNTYNVLNQPLHLDTTTLIAAYFIHVIWAAIAEELFFRSMVFKTVRLANRPLAYMLSISVFVVAHGQPEQMIIAIFLGFLLCYVYEKTNSILASIIVHITYNTLGVINTYLYIPPWGVGMPDLFKMTHYDFLLEAIKMAVIGCLSLGGLILIVTNSGKKYLLFFGGKTMHQNNQLTKGEKITIFAISIMALGICIVPLMMVL